MMYICDKCGYKIELNEQGQFCPNCGNVLSILNSSDTNEIDAIIDSILEESIEVKKSKIINVDEENKKVMFSKDSIIIRNEEKCINCGLCKKTCENIANNTYNLNICSNPICTGCGECVLSCPSKALSYEKNYREIKNVIDANEKIVVGIISPDVYSMCKEIYGVEKIEDAEKKLIGGLRKLGFDYLFNSGFGSDILVLEESTEIINRISKKENMPFFTSFCPSFVKYMEIYHPSLLNNLSTCKSMIEISNNIIKNYFVTKKGFEKDRIVTVSISNCLARKMEKKENDINTDYFMTSSELALLFAEEEIDLKNVESSNYDNIVGETSGSAYLMSVSGGHLEALIRTIYRIINKKDLNKNEIDIYELRGNEDLREATVQLDTFKLKVSVVSDMKNLEKLLENDSYKKYHIIEVSHCKGGCINGCGQYINENSESNKLIKERNNDIYKLDNICQNRYSYENKEVKEIYKKYLSNPGSEKSKASLHSSYINKSLLLKE